MTLQVFKNCLLTRPEILCVVMFAGLLPLTYQFILFHPDEQHYVDAGIKMIESGDYLTPLTPDGELRLRKPIIPYWFVLAGYQTFGISPLGSRIGFVLGACLLVWMTWKLADRMFASQTAGMFAALIVMCHAAVSISAVRAVPDMCLALFTTLSCWGFVSILRQRQATTPALLAAYGGGMLAVLSKGIPAAAFVVFATAFLILRERTLFVSAWRRFGLAIVASTLGSLSWFAWMWWQHGNALFEQFVGDQVGRGRFAANLSQIAWQFPMLLLMVGLTFGPWLLPNWFGLARTRDSLRGLFKRSDVQLMLSWSLVFIGLASTICFVTVRYLLPIVPLLAAVIGGALSQVAAADLKKPMRVLLNLTLMAVMSAVFLFATTFWSSSPAIVGVCGLMSGFVILRCWSASSAWEGVTSAVGVGCATYSAIGIAAIGAYPIVFPSVAHQVAAKLQTVRDSRPVLLVSQSHQSGVTQAARLRVALLGSRPVILASPSQSDLNADDFVAVVSDQSTLPILSEADWKTQQLPLGFKKFAVREALRATFSGRLTDFLAQNRTTCVFATRPDADVPQVVEAAFKPHRDRESTAENLENRPLPHGRGTDDSRSLGFDTTSRSKRFR